MHLQETSSPGRGSESAFAYYYYCYPFAPVLCTRRTATAFTDTQKDTTYPAKSIAAIGLRSDCTEKTHKRNKLQKTTREDHAD